MTRWEVLHGVRSIVTDAISGRQFDMPTGLPTRELHLCYVPISIADQSALDSLLPQLTAEEQVTAQRYRFLKDRLAFAAGRALVRKTLSRFHPEPAEGWRFVPNAFGKPELASASDTPDIRFNLSHCRGLVIAGFALGRDIGVDVEWLERASDGIELARANFAPSEIEILEGVPVDRQQETFLSLWTLKEAYVKAKGRGLAIPLDGFSVALSPPRLLASSLEANSTDHWFLWQCKPIPSHVVAVATERMPDENLQIRLERVDLEGLCSGS